MPWEIKSIGLWGLSGYWSTCSLKLSSSKGAEAPCIFGVTEGSQEIIVLVTEESLIRNKGQKLPIMIGQRLHASLVYLLRSHYFRDPKGHQWDFGIAALEMEDIKQLSTLLLLSEDPSAVRLLRVEQNFQHPWCRQGCYPLDQVLD